MPPKKSSKKRTDVKQKRSIQSRLMQLSLKIDDYIYMKKDISVEDAQSFKQEILSYKKTCRNDVRTTQVINKLTRLLQKIIEEQTSKRQIETAQTHPETVVHNDSSKESANITDVTPDAENVQDLTENNFNPNREESNATSSEKSQNDVPFFKSNVDITNNTQGDQINKLSTIKCIKSKAENDNVTKHISNENINPSAKKQVSFNSSHEKSNIIIPEKSKIGTQIVTNTNITQCGQIQDLDNIEIINSTPTEINEDLQATESITEDLEKTQEKLQTKHTSPTIADTIHHANQNIKSNGNNTIKDNYHTDDKKGGNDTKKQTVNQPIIRTPKRKPAKDAKNKQCNSRKKSKKTKTDLSWIDNIKYVREITNDEYDPKLNDLSESFWDNCVFPRDWDKSDFLLN